MLGLSDDLEPICFATGFSTVFKGNRLFDPESLGNWQRDSLRHVDVVTGCLLLMPAALWRGLGGFDPAFWMYGEDQDLAVRLKRAGYRPVVTPDAVLTHYVGASSSPGNKLVMVLGSRVRLMRKHWSAPAARLGIVLLELGCGLRAILARSDKSWLEGWRRRAEWVRVR